MPTVKAKPLNQKFMPKSETDWLLGLTICEELVKRNGMQNAPLPAAVIAAAVDCSTHAVQLIEKEALRKLTRKLSHLRSEVKTRIVPCLKESRPEKKKRVYLNICDRTKK